MILESHDKRAEQLSRINAILDNIPDPEIPVISIRELGILRDVSVIWNTAGPNVEVTIAPTYSGCPAISQIEDDIRSALTEQGCTVALKVQLSPAWTTDWIGPDAREKLRIYGIASPHATGVDSKTAGTKVIQFASKRVANSLYSTGTSALNCSEPAVKCPQCNSANTTEISHFGSTACKALYRCLDCLEPFDYFKPY